MTTMIYNGNEKYSSKKDCYRVRVAHCLWWIPILSFPNRSFRSGWQVRHTTDPGESLDANIAVERIGVHTVERIGRWCSIFPCGLS